MKLKALNEKGPEHSEPYLVDPRGLEPLTAGPKPAVLPITPWVNRVMWLQKYMNFFCKQNLF